MNISYAFPILSSMSRTHRQLRFNITVSGWREYMFSQSFSLFASPSCFTSVCDLSMNGRVR